MGVTVLNRIKRHWYGTTLSVLATLLVASLPFDRIPSWDVMILGVSFTLRLSLLFGAALIALSVPLLWRKRTNLQHIQYYLLLAFGFFYLLSALAGTDLKRALTVYAFTMFTLLLSVSVSVITSRVNKQWAEKALLYATWIALIFGFYQFFGDIFSLPSNITGLRDIYTKVVFGIPRIQSVGLEPLYYANFLLLPLLYFSSKFLSGDDERPYLIALIVTQIVLTISRGALIAGATGVITLLILMARKKRYTQSLGLLALIFVGVALALNLTGITILPDSKTQSGDNVTPNEKAVAVVDQATNLNVQDDRVRNRTLAWEAFKTSPILGIGPGNFNRYARDKYEGYRTNDGSYVIVNNEPLELLAEGGLLGLGFFVAFISLLWWRVTKLAWQSHSSVAGIWPAAISAYFVAMAIQYQTFSTLYIVHLWVVIGIAMALTIPGLMPQTAKVQESKQGNSKKKNSINRTTTDNTGAMTASKDIRSSKKSKTLAKPKKKPQTKKAPKSKKNSRKRKS